MAEDIVVQVTESPIVLQYTKQGIEGVPGQMGEKGEPGVNWELTISMSGSPDGTCTMQLYKNGQLNTENRYVEVYTCTYDSNSYQYQSGFSGTITGTKTFNYTNTRMIRGTVYSDPGKEQTFTSNTCNFGKSATVSIGTVTNVPQGSEYVTNSGSSVAAVLNFGLPKGDEPVIAVGNTVNGGYASDPVVTGREGNHNPVDLYLDFRLPNGVGDASYVIDKRLYLEASAVYEPSVSSTGVMSWSNNAQLTNPASVQITPNPRGAWSASTSNYKRLDTVTYNGGSYIATAASIPTGTVPTNTSYWQVIAARGADGQDGDLMYATFDVDLTTGQLMMYADENYDGANFSINASGNLVVTI